MFQNYGYSYKAVINEKFGDGIMSAITFSTTVKKGKYSFQTIHNSQDIFLAQNRIYF